MNNPLSNLPPFYVGQKVECIKPNYTLKKGEIFTVISIRASTCNCCGFEVNVGFIGKYTTIDCYNCGICGITNEGYWDCNRFKPIQESQFPSLTYSKVIEKESELISLN